MLLFAAWELQQESARYRSPCVTTWIRAAAESGKKFVPQSLPLFLFYCFCFFTCLFLHLRQLLPWSYHNPSDIHRGIIEGFIYLLNLLAGLLLGAALSFLASSVSGKLSCHIVTTP